MDNKNRNRILESFLNDPSELYNNPERLNDSDKSKLIEMEEKIITLKYLEHAAQMVSPLLEEETDSLSAETEMLERQIEFGGSLNLQHYHLLTINKLMKNQAIPSIPVPSVLMGIVNHVTDEQPAAEKRRSPSIIVNICEQGIKVIKSTLQGMAAVPDVGLATRSAAALLESDEKVVLKQSVAEELSLEYQIIREGDSRMMLQINFLQKKPGTYRARLQREGRTVLSQTIYNEDSAVQLSGLSTGDYTIEITGPVNYSFDLTIQAE